MYYTAQGSLMTGLVVVKHTQALRNAQRGLRPPRYFRLLPALAVYPTPRPLCKQTPIGIQGLPGALCAQDRLSLGRPPLGGGRVFIFGKWELNKSKTSEDNRPA